MSTDRIGVLFVCMGNICRSPLAESIFEHLATEGEIRDRFDVDSCGTGGWHVGEVADERSIAVAKKHGIKLTSRARQLNPARDFERFDMLIAMDQDNVDDMLRLGAPKDQVHLMRSFDPELKKAKGEELDVPDPYYGSGDGFEMIFTMLEAACAGLLDQLKSKKGKKKS